MWMVDSDCIVRQMIILLYWKQNITLPNKWLWQVPSLHDLLNVSVGSSSFFIFINASRTIGPHLKTSFPRYDKTQWKLIALFIVNFSWLGQCCTNSSIAFNLNIDQLRMYIHIYSNLLPHRRCFHNMLKENVEETLGLWIVTSLVTFIKSVNQSSIKPCLMLKETNV